MRYLFVPLCWAVGSAGLAQCGACSIGDTCTVSPPFPTVCPQITPVGYVGHPYELDVTFWIPASFPEPTTQLNVVVDQVTGTARRTTLGLPDAGVTLVEHVLATLAGLVAPLFLRLLRRAEKLFDQMSLPLLVRLTLGGLIVGVIAVWVPEVCGNGYSMVVAILNGNVVWSALLLIVVCKGLATGASVGSGAAEPCGPSGSVGSVTVRITCRWLSLAEAQRDADAVAWVRAVEPEWDLHQRANEQRR